MQRLEKTISLVALLGLISCLTISYSLKISQNIAPYASAQTDTLVLAQEKITQSKIININTASRYQLTRLPGIGPKFAERIIEYRDAHGSFSSCQEIKQVKGIGQKKYQAISDKITVTD